jgi:Bifunctional DNA primase/polymerase, N-terminal/Primase C terminal 1 (PriCT-1)
VGAFLECQSQYAEVGLPTFPISASDKRPRVRGYAHMGLVASRQLAMEGIDGDGLACMAGKRNRLTVIDIDARGVDGERLLAEAQRDFGASKLIVRTGNGGFHAYYKHNGEGRRIRPDPRTPIDLLGGGVVVLPPSRGASRLYEIIHGKFDDLRSLTPLRRTNAPLIKLENPDNEHVGEGRRNDRLFGYCMKAAHQCEDFNDLLDVARTRNSEMLPPLDEGEVVKTARSAWQYTESGNNRFGRTGVWFSTNEANVMIFDNQDAFVLLAFLRANNGPSRTFMVANGLAGRLGWTIKRIAAARRRLEESHIVMVRRPSERNGPAQYRWRTASSSVIPRHPVAGG